MRRSSRNTRRGRPRVSAAAAWTPLALPDVTAYYLADNVTTSSGAVTQWSDATPNANHLTQATAARQPTLVTDGDGKPAVNFDRTNYQFLTKTSTTANATAAFTFAMWIFPASGTSGSNSIAFSQWEFGTNKQRIQYRNYADMYCLMAADNSRWEKYATGLGTWRHVAVVYDGAGASNAARVTVYLNGSVTSVSGFSGTIPSALGSYSQVSVGVFPGAASASNAFSGRLDQLVLVNRAITAAEVVQLRDYRSRG